MGFSIRQDVDLPRQPVLLVALDGWIDAGDAAELASTAVIESTDLQQFATFVVDDLLDLRSRRPRQLLVDGVRGDLIWSQPELLVGADRFGSGLALLVGPEPDYRWMAFAKEVASLAGELGARLVVNLGGFPAATPHTRTVHLAATASNAELAERVGFIEGALDVPAGIADAIGAECATLGIPSVGLWARVPHYLASMPFAPAALALVDGFSAISGVTIDTEELQEAASESRRVVDELIAQSHEHEEMVRELEAQADQASRGDINFSGGIPSGDEIAAELERFLRGEAGNS